MTREFREVLEMTASLSSLPTGIVPATQFYPRTMLIVSEFKTGKSAIASKLSCTRKALWIDYEEEEAGDFLPGHKINIPQVVRTINALPESELFRSLATKDSNGKLRVTKIDYSLRLWKDLAAEDPLRYDYIFHDKVDTLEDWAERWATTLYKQTVIGKSFSGDSVLELAEGGGYHYLRLRFLDLWNAAVKASAVAVFMGSLRTNKKTDKTGNVYEEANVDLCGKVRKIAGGRCDAPGIMWREPGDSSNWITFKSASKGFAGMRFPALEGEQFKLSWKNGDGSLHVDWGRMFPEEERDGLLRLKRTAKI